MKREYDMAILGAGPAGMTAALYASRGGAKVLLLDRTACGGQMLRISEIENYPGFSLVSGSELSAYMREQLLSAGAEFEVAEADEVHKLENGFSVSLSGGKKVVASCVIFTGGTRLRQLGCPGETEYLGRGVSYCASCDGNFFRGKRVVVVGGRNAALHEAVYLSGICASVTLIHRGDTLRAGAAEIREAEYSGRIRLLLNRTVLKITGDDRVSAVSVAGPEGEEEIETDGVFVAIGSEPDTARFAAVVPLGKDGGILAGEDGKTACEGAFAAGDIRFGAVRQIVTASADGARAAISALSFLSSEKTCRGEQRDV